MTFAKEAKGQEKNLTLYSFCIETVMTQPVHPGHASIITSTTRKQWLDLECVVSFLEKSRLPCKSQGTKDSVCVYVCMCVCIYH